jgi:hypothetical protein
MVYTVSHVSTVSDRCNQCGKEGVYTLVWDVAGGAEELSTVIKIDPPPVAEDVPAVEELTA